MPANPSPSLTRLRVPVPLPSPWFWGLVVLYVLLGLVGHDPWKSDDAVGFGIAWSMANGQWSDWLLPNVAGQAVAEEGPLPFWLAALFIKMLGGLLLPHDAARLATGVWTAIAVFSVHRAASALDGATAGRLAVLAFLACLGLLARMHEIAAEPAFLAGWSLVLWSLALPSRAGRSALLLAAGLALCLLSRGSVASIPVVLTCLAWATWVAARGDMRRAGALAAGLTAGAACYLLWEWRIAGQQAFASGYAAWRAGQAGWTGADAWRYYLKTLPWFTFPAWPVALWWCVKRRPPKFLDVHPVPLVQPLPLAALACVLASLAWSPAASESVLLPLLPVMALLVAPGLSYMGRGQAALIDWFGRITFTLVAALLWLGYFAQVAMWPPRIAANFARLEPGFPGVVHLPSVVIAAAATLAWAIAIARSQRTPLRGIVHWCYGTTLTWLLLTTLWLPWIDYGRSYRPVTDSMQAALAGHRTGTTCIETRNLGLAERASFAYFAGLTFADARRGCRWLLVQDTRTSPQTAPAATRLVWEGHRPGDRSERFRLYQGNK